MEDLIVEEICRKCNWYERIIVKLLKKIIIKVYNIVREKIINTILK